MINASKMALAFSVSTAALPLVGWVVGVAIFETIASVSAWVVLTVFCGVGVWIIKEAFEDESPKGLKSKISSFWVLLAMGTLGSIDEGAIGIGYPFLAMPIGWIVGSVVLTNIILIFFAMLISTGQTKVHTRMPSFVSGVLLIVFGIVSCLELLFSG